MPRTGLTSVNVQSGEEGIATVGGAAVRWDAMNEGGEILRERTCGGSTGVGVALVCGNLLFTGRELQPLHIKDSGYRQPPKTRFRAG